MQQKGLIERVCLLIVSYIYSAYLSVFLSVCPFPPIFPSPYPPIQFSPSPMSLEIYHACPFASCLSIYSSSLLIYIPRLHPSLPLSLRVRLSTLPVSEQLVSTLVFETLADSRMGYCMCYGTKTRSCGSHSGIAALWTWKLEASVE